ncbi:MAG: Gfo/Idh/MocA family oxidoreductase [Verrucomicrobiota bacterium]
MSGNYDLKSVSATAIAAPELPYAPPAPRDYRPKIGLIGCGGITEHHLQAYQAAGWEVAAFYDAHKPSAEKRRDAFYPNARVCDSVDEMMEIPGIDVLDIATHPGVRVPLIEQAIAAGKHVLSQKPFVTELVEGERLVALAKAAGVKLAVNQNGRWAPYFSYMRQAVRAGLIGEVGSVDIAIHWDHTWTAGTAFENIHHLVLYDFGIHWFDAACSFFGTAAQSVQATTARFPDQPIQPPMLASAMAIFPHGRATLVFNACSRFGPLETCTVVGTKGTLRASGPVCGITAVDLITSDGTARADLTGSWFPDGFRGAMGELLCAIEDNREPENSAAENLKSLALCFAAMKAAEEERLIKI